MTAALPKRLLIVDDDPGLLRLIQKTLTREGYTCSIAASGAEAIKSLNEAPVDLLLLDLKLQDMNAGELIQRIGVCGRGTPFLIITGQGDERVAVEMMKRGALDYVVKDANFLEFLPTLVSHAIAQINREARLASAENTVKENERRYRETLDGMMEGCQTVGFDWTYLYVNQAAARHGRRSIDELLGRTFMDVYPGIENTPIFAELAKCMVNRTARNLETEFHYGDGESAWFQLSVQPVPEGLFILSLDITRRKEAERFQHLQYDVALVFSDNNSLTDAVRAMLERICHTFQWRVGEFWTVEKSNNRLRLLSHWASGSLSHRWEEFTQTVEMEPDAGIPGRAWHTRSPLFIANVMTDRKFMRRELAEEPGMQSAFAFPVSVRDEVLGVLLFFGVSRPPSEELMNCFAAIGSGLGQFLERKKLEKEVLEISHKEQNRLGRDLHDGLGQQLTALELFTVSLAKEADAKSRMLGKKVRKLGEHLREAIKQSRAMANGLSPVSLNEGGLVTALGKLADGTRTMATVDCEFFCPSPVEVGLDASIHLYRIAQEATNNALKHGPPTKIRIALVKQDDGQLQLTIEDNGRGFASASASTDPSGGMGLRVMRYRAGLIGAKIGIGSAPGKGTRVTCVLRKFA